MDETLGAVVTHLRSITKGLAEDDSIHIAFLVVRAANIQTSLKTEYRNSYSYKVGNQNYTVKDVSIFPFIRSATAKYGKKNGLKCFFAGLEDAVMVLGMLSPEIFDTRVSCNRGAPKGKGYLSADFMSGCSQIQSDHDRSIIVRASEQAIMKASGNSTNDELVSLFDLGRRY